MLAACGVITTRGCAQNGWSGGSGSGSNTSSAAAATWPLSKRRQQVLLHQVAAARAR